MQMLMDWFMKKKGQVGEAVDLGLRPRPRPRDGRKNPTKIRKKSTFLGPKICKYKIWILSWAKKLSIFPTVQQPFNVEKNHSMTMPNLKLLMVTCYVCVIQKKLCGMLTKGLDKLLLINQPWQSGSTLSQQEDPKVEIIICLPKTIFVWCVVETRIAFESILYHMNFENIFLRSWEIIKGSTYISLAPGHLAPKVAHFSPKFAHFSSKFWSQIRKKWTFLGPKICKYKIWILSWAKSPRPSLRYPRPSPRYPRPSLRYPRPSLRSPNPTQPNLT